jgi:hypothetical protein
MGPNGDRIGSDVGWDRMGMVLDRIWDGIEWGCDGIGWGCYRDRLRVGMGRGGRYLPNQSLWEIHGRYMASGQDRTGICWIALGCAGSHWDLLDPTGMCWIPLGSAGSHWDLLDRTGICWIALGSAGSHWDLLDPTGMCWIALGSAGSHWDLLDRTGICWIPLGSAGSHTFAPEVLAGREVPD